MFSQNYLKILVHANETNIAIKVFLEIVEFYLTEQKTEAASLAKIGKGIRLSKQLWLSNIWG